MSNSTSAAPRAPVRSVWLTITENGLHEGGRPRDTLEVYFPVNKTQAAFFGSEPFVVQTDDRHVFSALVSGHSGHDRTPKNLRSQPVRKLGEWLVARKGARVGDQVQATAMGDGVFFFRHVPAGTRR